jgi:hypothetical protein
MYFAHFRVRPVRPGRRAAVPLDRITARRRALTRGRAVLIVLGFAFAVLGAAAPAQAHGIAGNRVFPGTLSFDDPAVMDEFTLTATSLKQGGDNNDVVDNVISWDFARLLTPTVSLAVGSGFIHRDWGDLRRSGFDEVDIMIKMLLYQNDVHEIMISAGVAGEIGRSGALGVGANQFTTVLPGVFFGKGFGDLPNGLAWLRPFAVTGAVSVEIPTSGTSAALDNSVPGELTPAVLRTDTIMHWGLSPQYSTFYLTPRYTGRLPREEPLDQFIPLVEFAFDSPMRSRPAATMNPGLAYVGDKYQVAMEAIVPLNNTAGRSAGVRAQLLLFTDDLIPSLFGQPVFGR